MLLFGVDVKLAGSLSLAISIPTIGVGLLRYSRKPGMGMVRPQRTLVAWMACGSVVGALIGSQLVHCVPGSLLRVILGIILLISAIRLAGLRAGESAVHE
jgi:uncharacterized protein